MKVDLLSKLMRGRVILAATYAVVCWLPVGACWAIDPERALAQLHHTSWTARDGAPTAVNAISQTDDGFLWFGTTSGLVRFDGVQFEPYVLASGEGLPAASIRSLYALPGNKLLIGWLFGGATLLHDGRAVTFGEKEGYPPGTTYGFLPDQDNQLWAATSSALARFDGQRWHRIGADWNFAGQRAIALFRVHDGTMGVFTDTTLMTLPKGATSFQATGGTASSNAPIVQARSGALYMADDQGLRPINNLKEYDRKDWPWFVKWDAPIVNSALVIDRDDGLWFGNHHGVGRVAHPEKTRIKAEYYSKNDGMSDASADFVFEDRDGTIWVTTNSGVDRFRAGSFVPPVGLLKTEFPAMLPDSAGGLWFGGIYDHLRYLSPQGEIRTMGSVVVTCAYRDADGVAWYGTRPPDPLHTAELLRQDGDRLTRVAMPPDIRVGRDVQAITADATHSVWLSVVREGVFRQEGKTWIHPAQLPDAGRLPALVMTADPQGRTWLGYPGNRVALWQNGTAHVYSKADGLEIGNVLAIYETASHLWVAGEHGLALFDSGRFRPVVTVEPNVLQGITGLVETDEGDLWVHGTAGAIHIDAVEIRQAIARPNHAMAYRLFDDEDGLAGTHTDVRPLPTLVRATNGRLWFSTNQGVFMIDPRNIVTNKLPPNIFIKAVSADKLRYISPVKLTLPPHTSYLNIDYTATSHSVPQRVQFQYKLVGVDRDWQSAGTRRQAFYTNLSPGKYLFQVIATNEDGVWNRTGASVEVTILPAWYQTIWFATLCVLAALVATAALYQRRVAQLRAQVRGRLQERLLERERIARELHDTLLQGFQGLVLTLGAATRRIPIGQPAREQMEKSLERADEVLADGRNRVRDLRNTVSLQTDLVAALTETADDLARVYSAPFTLAVQGVPRALHRIVIEEAYRIAREALTNAFQHAAAGKIELEINYGSKQFRVYIRDDGKGIAADVLAAGGIAEHWGLAGMHERAQKLGARLFVRSTLGSGTDVELDIPAAVAYRDRRQWRTWLSGLSPSGANHDG